MVLAAHQEWAGGLPEAARQPGQSVPALVEGRPVHVPTDAATYYEIRFLSVDAAFVDFLRAKSIPFREDGGRP
jgi:hypothetical protein